MDNNLDQLVSRREQTTAAIAGLTRELRETDQAIARLSSLNADAPYVVTRPDGTVYGGRYAGWVRDYPPQRFMYRAVAARRAVADGGIVVPFTEWTNRRETQPQETA